MEARTCNSCKKQVVNDRGTAHFPCPQCSKFELVRCSHCRTTAAPYKCPGCEFVGPN